MRALAGKTPDEIICIGTSATLSDPAKKDKDNDETARRFASRFFGVDAGKVDAGRRVLRQPGVAHAALPPVAPHGDGMDRLGRVLDAVTEPVEVWPRSRRSSRN